MPAISRFISRTLREVHHSYQIAISTVLKFMVVARNQTSRSQKPMDRGIFAVNAVCLKRVVSRLHGRSSMFAYHQLSPVSDGFDAGEMQKRGSGGTDTVRVVVGRERRVFEVDSCVLEEDPFQVLFDLTRTGKGIGGVIFVDCDSLLFEHMLWLLNNDWPSFFNLKLKDIIESMLKTLPRVVSKCMCISTEELGTVWVLLCSALQFGIPTCLKLSG